MFWHRAAHKLALTGALLSYLSFLAFFPCGGMVIRGDQDGMWLLFGPEKRIALAVLFVSVTMTLIGVLWSGKLLEADKSGQKVALKPAKEPSWPGVPK